MTDLPASSHVPTLKTVPMDAPRPTARWIVETVTALLSIYYQTAGPDDPVFGAQMQLWKLALMDVPQKAIEIAVTERIRSPDRTRPIPGEIRTRALSHVKFEWPALTDQTEATKELVSYDEARKLAEKGGHMDNPWTRTMLAAIRERERG